MPSKVRVLSDELVSRFGKNLEWDNCQFALSKMALPLVPQH
jgi:hypothetical protein